MNDDRLEAAIACSLSAAQLADRREVWEQLAREALRESRSTAEGVQLVYAASWETERQLQELARLEAECCSFARWEVTRTGDQILLDVTSGADGVTALRALFGLS